MVLNETSKRGSSFLSGLSTLTNNGASGLPSKYASECRKAHWVEEAGEPPADTLS